MEGYLRALQQKNAGSKHLFRLIRQSNIRQKMALLRTNDFVTNGLDELVRAHTDTILGITVHVQLEKTAFEFNRHQEEDVTDSLSLY